MTNRHPGRPKLRIYVAADCAGCRTARAIADAVRHARPKHPIEVIDLADQPGELARLGETLSRCEVNINWLA